MVQQDCFSQPTGCTGAVGTACPLVYGTSIGNVARNAYRGPGYIQNNASLFKTFALHENWTFDFRCDAFQLTNSPQFASPSNSLHQWNLWAGHQHGRQRYRDQRDRRRPRTATCRYVALLRHLASAGLIAGSRCNSFLSGC